MATALSISPATMPAFAARDGGTASFLDFRFQLSDEAEVCTAIEARAASAPFAYVVTPNVDHVVRVQRRRSDVWPAYRHAWLTLCDSRIISRLATSAGMHLPVVPGSDLTEALFRKTIRRDDRIAILGGDPAAVERLCRKYALTDVVHHNPPMNFINDPAEVARAVDFITRAHARYCFIAVGSPQQEVLAYRVEGVGQATGIGLCVGASLDFLAGGQTRAPRFMQWLALEWLYRLLSNPRRLWRRYLVEGPAIFAIFWHWRHQTV